MTDEEGDSEASQYPKYLSPSGPELFDPIEIGFHGGFAIQDLGGAAISIREALGIEPLVALARYGTASGYYEWVQEKVGASLDDWEPVTLSLFEGWRTVLFSYSRLVLPFSYRVWSVDGRMSDAAAIRPVEVFALRHKAWPLLQENRVREFFVDLQRSSMNAKWSRNKTTRPMEPEDMEGETGFVVSGRKRGAERSVVLTWPNANILEVIEAAEQFRKRRVANILISQAGGIGFPYNMRTRNGWLRIADRDKRWGGNSQLVDLSRGIL